MNLESLLDLLLETGSITPADAVCVALLLPDQPIRLNGCLLDIGTRTIEYATPEAATAALLAAEMARELSGR